MSVAVLKLETSEEILKENVDLSMSTANGSENILIGKTDNFKETLNEIKLIGTTEYLNETTVVRKAEDRNETESNVIISKVEGNNLITKVEGKVGKQFTKSDDFSENILIKKVVDEKDEDFDYQTTTESLIENSNFELEKDSENLKSFLEE